MPLQEHACFANAWYLVTPNRGSHKLNGWGISCIDGSRLNGVHVILTFCELLPVLESLSSAYDKLTANRDTVIVTNVQIAWHPKLMGS